MVLIKYHSWRFHTCGFLWIFVIFTPPKETAEFAVFAKTWSFTHVTSSLTLAQSNGKAESAVKTVKRLFTKCQESGHSEYLALLDWRNTSSQVIGTSPAQRLMGRQCKTLLPIAGTLLMPRHNNTAWRNTSIGRSKGTAAILLQQKRKATTTHHPWGNYKDATTRREALNEGYVCTRTG